LELVDITMNGETILERTQKLKKYLPGQGGPLVTVLNLNGVIGAMGGFRRGLTMSSVEPLLERAFKPSKLSAVAISINSPGGSPVQSALIGGRIRALAEEKEVPVIAFAEDVAASGGYWLACAADEIYADSNSIIGSIGVVSGGFGFSELIKKYGIERRLHTSGDKKAMLDSFSPEKPADVKFLKSLQKEIHDGFIDMVQVRRGDRLKGSPKELFSGAFWTGATAVELGLIDGLGELRTMMRERFGEDVRFKKIEEHESFFKRKFGISQISSTPNVDIGNELGKGLISAAEERMIWNRFGF
jgi:signal peptide peptidase SppA